MDVNHWKKNTPLTVLLQEKVEENVLGRVFGVLGMISSSMIMIKTIDFPEYNRYNVELADKTDIPAKGISLRRSNEYKNCNR